MLCVSVTYYNNCFEIGLLRQGEFRSMQINMLYSLRLSVSEHFTLFTENRIFYKISDLEGKTC